MKPESVSRIIQAVDAEVQRVGFKDWDAAMEFAKTALNAPDGVVPFAINPLTDRILSRSELEQLYKSQPEPTRGGLDHEIKQIRQLARGFRRFLIQTVKKEIPSDPGGRRSVLGTPQEQERRVQRVLLLFKKGMNLTEALKRVGREENISLSSMQRIWRKRKIASKKAGHEDEVIETESTKTSKPNKKNN
jgi:hypothetical protein